MKHLMLALTCMLILGNPMLAQTPTSDEAVELLLARFEQALQAADQVAYEALFDPTVATDEVEQLAERLFVPDAIRTAVRERDRTALEGAPEGDGHRLVVELFIETAGRARILTIGLDIRRPPGGEADSWRVVAADGLAFIDGLYRLHVNTDTQYTARNLVVTSDDLVLTLAEGAAFLVEAEDGAVTGMVLMGRGAMEFAPTPEVEKRQVEIFSDSRTLIAPFETAFVRFNPSDYRTRVGTASLTPAPAVDPRLLRQAGELFVEEGSKSLSLNLGDLSDETWHVMPPLGDFVAEVQTQRHGSLTYARSGIQAEDISLFSRERGLTIALYASQAKLAARGRFYTDDSLVEYDVLDYNIEAAIYPDREFIQGRARLSVRIRTAATNTLTLRLAQPLTVSSIVSLEYGRLLHLQVRDQNTIVINLPTTLLRDADITLVISYAGQLPSQETDREALDLSAAALGQQFRFSTGEKLYLLSNRSYWYPQNPISDYATATMRITVPRGYSSIASGQPTTIAVSEATLRDLLTIPSGESFTFRADQPLRYLSVAVSRLRHVASTTVTFADADSDVQSDLEGRRQSVVLSVETNPRLESMGRGAMESAQDIMRFYAALMDDAPYSTATVALVESDVPGGHSPGYFAVVNTMLPTMASPRLRNDPGVFTNVDDFYLAHELAHQWWGQAVGWKNYHEQWISEGFAQYFAALYAQENQGDDTFQGMLRQFRRWAVSESNEGPIYLGYRLGHLKGDSRIFRALVYNKGAAVLHMLRRWLGDDVFFSGLRSFYASQKFTKAGTDDLRLAFESASGKSLERFFERWVYESEIPQIRYSSAVEGNEVVLQFDQLSDQVFDVPVTVNVSYTDGGSEDFVVVLTESHVEHRIPVESRVRRVQLNRDNASLADFRDR